MGGLGGPRDRPRGIAAVARASGIAPNTIAKGIGEIEADERLEGGRVRRLGAGRKPISQTDPELLDVLGALVAEDCRGDPMQVLLWTSRSVRNLAGELRERGHEVGRACSPTPASPRPSLTA